MRFLTLVSFGFNQYKYSHKHNKKNLLAVFTLPFLPNYPFVTTKPINYEFMLGYWQYPT